MQPCRGYRRKEFVFLNEGWRAPGRSSRCHSQRGQPPRHSSPKVAGEVFGPVSTPTIERARPTMSPHLDDTMFKYGTPLPKSISPDPMQAYVAFFLAQFAATLPREATFFLYHCRRSFDQLLSKSHPISGGSEWILGDPMIRAAEALVKGHFAKLHRSSWLLHESVGSYATALKSLSIGLDEVRRIGIPFLRDMDWMDLVFACVLLTFWEVSYSLHSLLIATKAER